VPLAKLLKSIRGIFIKTPEPTPETEAEPSYSKEILEIAKDYGYPPAVIAEVRGLPLDELEKLGEAYLVEQEYRGPLFLRLQPAQDLLAPFLISALDRPDVFTALPKNSSLSFYKTRGEKALSFLENGVHPEVKNSLLRVIKTKDRDILGCIVTPLVSFGSDDLLPTVAALIETDDEWLAWRVSLGALEAIDSGRAENGFRDYVWHHCVKLIRSANPPMSFNHIGLLLAIDKEAIKQVLLDDVVPFPNHALLPSALFTLNSLKCPPDPAILEQFLADDTLKEKDIIHQAAVLGLILQNHPGGIGYIDKIFRNPGAFSDDMVLAAWNARYQMRGLTSIYDSAFEVFEAAGYTMDDTFSPDQRSIVIIHYLDAEISNGGFWQWFFNEGELAEEALQALEKIGARRHAAVLRKANRLFGWKGPPKTREEVQRALEKMSDRTSEKMGDLNHDWFDLPTWQLAAAAWDWKRQTKGLRSEG
jgi:hypothetical protein